MDDNRPPISAPASSSSILTLAINVFLPGVGTIVGGRPPLGVAQLALFLVGIGLLFVGWTVTFLLSVFGGFAIVAAWVWGIITGVQAMSSSSSSGPTPPGVSGGRPDFH